MRRRERSSTPCVPPVDTHYRLAIERELIHVLLRERRSRLVPERDEGLSAHAHVAVGDNGSEGVVRLEQRRERLLHDCGLATMITKAQQA